MNVIYLLLPLALIFVLIFVGFYLWAAKKGQFDDLESPSQRILVDDLKDSKTADKKKA
jgi:cbb3-type cytochrome oxidase maturation protein